MNLEHCFLVSMTAHSISVLSELKMSFFDPTQAQRHALHQLRCRTLHSVDGRAECPTVPRYRELVIGTRVAGQGSK